MFKGLLEPRPDEPGGARGATEAAREEKGDFSEEDIGFLVGRL
jgi:hypothetical protein